MRAVHKYPFTLDDEVSVEMPVGARVIRVDRQNHTNCLWAVVDPGARREARRFYVRGTGHPLPEGSLEHVATWFDGPFVWHMFE